jgi:hypothetical protein
MSRVKVLITALIAVGAVALVLSTSSADDAPADGVVVHEWGTFTSLCGSDGKSLEFHTALNDLPNFVVTTEGPYRKEWLYSRTSMETPVVYFYTKQPSTVSVSVDFNNGFLTEWYPSARLQKLNDKNDRGRLAWEKVELDPAGATDFPIDSERAGSHYYAARETDAVPLKLPNAKVHEKFLFYRGSAWFDQPVSLGARGGNKFVVRNASDRLPAAAFLLQASEKGLRFRALGAMKEMEASVELSKDTISTEEAGNQLVKALVTAGLFEKEARAMVKTWTDTWLEEAGTRLLYVIPSKTVEEWLPITIKPAPAKLTRVMVGRVDVLTPENERDMDAHVKRAYDQSRSEADRTADYAAMSKRFGRFYSGAYHAADSRYSSKK